MRRLTWVRCGLMALMAVTIVVMLTPAAADASIGNPVSYVAGPGGLNASDATDGNICNVELTPCATIAGALMQTAVGGIIEISGTLSESSPAQVNQDITIEADSNSTSSPKAEIEGSSDSGGLLTLSTDDTALTVTGITLTDASGGAINVDQNAQNDTLDVSDSTFSNNTSGGAIDSELSDAAISVTDSTFTDNSASEGGAISDSGSNSGGGSLTVTGSTFSGNDAGVGGAIANAYDNDDSGNNTTLTVSDSTFTDNTAVGAGGAIDTADGGEGEADITDSTFSGNTATDGGAITNGWSDDSAASGPAILTISDSTLSGNAASQDGGAIDNAQGGGSGNDGAGDLTIVASTLSGNLATTDGNTIDTGDGDGGGAVTLGDDVIAGTCYTGSGTQTHTWHDADDNVTSSSTCPEGVTNGTNGDVVLSSLASDLGTLANNGGPTQTIELLAGNPAIDLLPNPFSHQVTVPTLTGSSSVTVACPVIADQRGIASAAGAGCDVGAAQFSTASTVYLAGSGGVHATAASDSNVCSNEATPCQTLSGALAQTAAGGTVELSGTLTETGATAVDQDVTLEANPDGSSAIIVGSSDTDGLLNLGDDTVTIQGLTLEDGIATSANQGGAISNNAGGTLNVTDSTFTGDSADDSGGAIVNADDSGGGGSVSGTANITGSSFVDDTALATSDYDGDGGAIDNGDNGATGTLTVSDSTFTDDGAVGSGGAIANGDHSGIGTATVSDSTFTANTVGSFADGGAIDNGDATGTGTLTVIDSTFAGNTSAGHGNTIDNDDHGGTGTVNLAGDVLDGSCDQPGGTWNDDGFNAATSSSCLGSAPSGRPDATVASATGDLGTLANNGGFTQTMELLVGNPAINLIPSATAFTVPNANGGTVPVACPVVADQRGVANAGSTGCDAGAVQFATQSVSFGATVPSSVVVGQSGATVSPSSRSGLAVSLTVDPGTTNSACGVSGDAVSFRHAGSCVLDASQGGNVNFAPAQGQGTITVNAAQTSTALSSSSSAVSATVSVLAPGGGTPTGTVLFSVGAQTIGSATLVDGVASVSYSVAANTTQDVTASYQGTDDYAGSSSSAADAGPTVATTTTTTTTTTTPPRTVVNPRITATLTSARPKTANGWWTSAVKLSFHCTTHGSPLTTGCPAAITLDRSGRRQKITRTIHARNGGRASITISGLNIDLTKPSVRIAGPNSKAHYLFHGSSARCLASDAVSGVRSCSLTHRVRAGAAGEGFTYTATATSNAGISARTSITIQVRTIGLLGAQDVDGVYQVRPGATYTLEVLSKSRPVYLDAAVSPLPPSPAHEYFVPAGKLHGITLWKLEVRIEPGLSLYKRWSIGVRTGPTVHGLQLST